MWFYLHRRQHTGYLFWVLFEQIITIKGFAYSNAIKGVSGLRCTLFTNSNDIYCNFHDLLMNKRKTIQMCQRMLQLVKITKDCHKKVRKEKAFLLMTHLLLCLILKRKSLKLKPTPDQLKRQFKVWVCTNGFGVVVLTWLSCLKNGGKMRITIWD